MNKFSTICCTYGEKINFYTFFGASYPRVISLVYVFTGLRTDRYSQIMRWWSSNLGQILLKYYTLPLVVTTLILSPCTTCLSRFLGRFLSPSSTAPHQ